MNLKQTISRLALMAGLGALTLAPGFAQGDHGNKNGKWNSAPPKQNGRHDNRDWNKGGRQDNNRWQPNPREARRDPRQAGSWGNRNDDNRWDRNNRWDEQRKWEEAQRRADEQRRWADQQRRYEEQRRRDEDWRRNNDRYSNNGNYGYRESDRRQQTKNEWRNLAIAAGAVAVLGLLEKDNRLVFAGSAGALYSAYRYEQDRKSQNRYDRARAYYFSQPYFYRDGSRYTRNEVWRDGEKYYQFCRG